MNCTHHWMIERYMGECKLCGEVKDFEPLLIKEGVIQRGIPRSHGCKYPENYMNSLTN